MLFCCLWRNVKASCHKHFVVFSRKTPPVSSMMFGVEKLEWFGYSTVKKIWRYAYSFRVNVTDGWTDTTWRHRPRLHSIAQQNLSLHLCDCRIILCSLPSSALQQLQTISQRVMYAVLCCLWSCRVIKALMLNGRHAVVAGLGATWKLFLPLLHDGTFVRREHYSLLRMSVNGRC